MAESCFIFPPPPSDGTCNINVDVSNFATKSEMKAISGVDTSVFLKSTEFIKINGDLDKIKEDDKKHLYELKKLKDNVAKTSADDITKLKSDVGRIKEEDKKQVDEIHRIKDDINKVKEDDKKELNIFDKKTNYGSIKDKFVLEARYSTLR